MKSIFALAVALTCASGLAAQPADTVFLNGSVRTMDPDHPTAGAIAVTRGQISFVGASRDAQALIGDGTEVIDLDGKMILPGFVSGHEHLVAAGWSQMGVHLGDGNSKQEYLDLIADYAAAHPDERFIRGSGWNPTKMGGSFSAADLDAIVPDRPVFLQDFTMHDSWMNSKALEMGGVDRDTPDPVPGLIYFVRDDDGNPTGYAKEFAWMAAYVKSGAWQPETMIPESQKALYDIAAKAGYTSYINQFLATPNLKDQDAHFEDTKSAMKMLQGLADENALKLRTFMMMLVKGDDFSAEKAVAHARELREIYNSDVLRIHGIKVHPEGVHTSHASVMLQPWKDKPEKKAIRGVSAQLTEAVVLAANAAGFDVSVHVDGSKTVRETIDSFIRSKQAGNTDARNTLQHLAFAHPDDIDRIIAHNLAVNITPIWATTWGGGLDGAMEILGKARTMRQFQRIRELMDAGAPVSIGADVPSTDPALMGVLIQCEAALTRRDPTDPEDGRVFPPVNQALSLDQCLYAATMGGAYDMRMEDRIGSIEFGKYADLVILEQDLYDVLPDEIADVQIMGTMMGGRFTYRDGI